MLIGPNKVLIPAVFDGALADKAHFLATDIIHNLQLEHKYLF